MNNPYGNVITSTFTAWFGEKFYILGFLPAIALALVLMYAPSGAGKDLTPWQISCCCTGFLPFCFLPVYDDFVRSISAAI